MKLSFQHTTRNSWNSLTEMMMNRIYGLFIKTAPKLSDVKSKNDERYCCN